MSKKKFALPTSLVRVTWFSRILALLLILAFIIAAFFVGMMFQRRAGEIISASPAASASSY